MLGIADLDKQEFDLFLAALSPDREIAGLEFERLRHRLKRYFEIRGSKNADLLADETLLRAALKASTFDVNRNVRFSTFIYGFAFNVLKEDQRKQHSFVPIDGYDVSFDRTSISAPESVRLVALESCLQKMPTADREVILAYYSADESSIAENRNHLSSRLGCSLETLYTRISRLRQKLANCVHSQIAEIEM